MLTEVLGTVEARILLVMPTLAPALAANLGSANERVRSSAAAVMDNLVAVVQPGVLLQSLSHIAMHSSNARAKVVLVEKLTALSPQASIECVHAHLPRSLQLCSSPIRQPRQSTNCMSSNVSNLPTCRLGLSSYCCLSLTPYLCVCNQAREFSIPADAVLSWGCMQVYRYQPQVVVKQLLPTAFALALDARGDLRQPAAQLLGVLARLMGPGTLLNHAAMVSNAVESKVRDLLPADWA